MHGSPMVHAGTPTCLSQQFGTALTRPPMTWWSAIADELGKGRVTMMDHAGDDHHADGHDAAGDDDSDQMADAGDEDDAAADGGGDDDAVFRLKTVVARVL